MALSYQHFCLLEGEVHFCCDIEQIVFGECFVEAQFPAHLLAQIGQFCLRHSQFGQVAHHALGVSILLEELRLMICAKFLSFLAIKGNGRRSLVMRLLDFALLLYEELSICSLIFL